MNARYPILITAAIMVLRRVLDMVEEASAGFLKALRESGHIK